MNLMYLKVLGGVGAGAAGITGIYFAVNNSKNPTTSTLGELGGGISQDSASANKELIRRVEESQKNNERTDTNAQQFIKDYELLKKPAADILKLLEEKLGYEIQSISEDSLKQNLDSYLLPALESFCAVEDESNDPEIFKKYCK